MSFPSSRLPPYLHTMKAARFIFWTIVALLFGAVAGVIIGGITLVAGILMIRDAIFRRSSVVNRKS